MAQWLRRMSEGHVMYLPIHAVRIFYNMSSIVLNISEIQKITYVPNADQTHH